LTYAYGNFAAWASSNGTTNQDWYTQITNPLFIYTH